MFEYKFCIANLNTNSLKIINTQKNEQNKFIWQNFYIYIKRKQHFKGAMPVLETKAVNLLMKSCTKLTFHEAYKNKPVFQSVYFS